VAEVDDGTESLRVCDLDGSVGVWDERVDVDEDFSLVCESSSSGPGDSDLAFESLSSFLLFAMVLKKPGRRK
jgi:hypothetical protein